MDIHSIRWMMSHFEKDPMEELSIRITYEIFRVLIIIGLGIAVYNLA